MLSAEGKRSSLGPEDPFGLGGGETGTGPPGVSAPQRAVLGGGGGGMTGDTDSPHCHPQAACVLRGGGRIWMGSESLLPSFPWPSGCDSQP